jgi:hypothetical protein
MRKISSFTLLLGVCLLVATSICLVLSLLAPEPKLTSRVVSGEQYSVDIAELTTISELRDRIELDIYEQELVGIEVPILIDNYVRNKFYHEYSTKPWYNNWVLAITDWIIPQYMLSGNMKPTDIVQYDYGICNQQAILFQNLVKEFGYDYGSVRFNTPNFGHFASAVNVDGDWYYFDQDLEPEYDRADSNVFHQIDLGNQQVLTRMYGDHFENITDDMIELSEINSFPAKRGVLAQDMSFALSWYGWLFVLLPSTAIIFYQHLSQGRRDDDHQVSSS